MDIEELASKMRQRALEIEAHAFPWVVFFREADLCDCGRDEWGRACRRLAD